MADFPRLLQEAAAAFRNESIAFAQIGYEGNQIKVRMQILEIGRQFVGSVTYGRDPKGVLFYNNMLAFDISNADFKYYKHGTGDLVTIEVYYYQQSDPTAYARYVARVRRDQVPHHTYGQGNGHWTDFKIASAQTRVIRLQGSGRFNFEFPALKKAAYITTSHKSQINAFGLFLFPNIHRLNNGSQLVAAVRPDLILFHRQGIPEENLGLFIPSDRLDNPEGIQVSVNWQELPLVASAEGEEGAEETGSDA